VSDAPGSLSKVTGIVGQQGGNIHDVQHRRHILAMPSRAAQLDLTVEVANADVAKTLIARIREAGFDVETVQGGLA
jgi:threonine dehydratase